DCDAHANERPCGDFVKVAAVIRPDFLDAECRYNKTAASDSPYRLGTGLRQYADGYFLGNDP
ncbi:MAG TPA: hypothetical protein VGU61_02845, partial [Noviherbaspirillum sp.]|uniref:hypothetical protein n=1 Tax=Noviherbaspirillum sp. TaxID=1926288 RepID=UPI002DDD289B